MALLAALIAPFRRLLEGLHLGGSPKASQRDRDIGVISSEPVRYLPGEQATLPGISYDYQPARLTEYHPDAPAIAAKLEGGPKDRKSNPIYTVEDAKSAGTPFVSVAADLTLRGERVKYGTRLYLRSRPDLTFRIVDTGGHFFGAGKLIRVAGAEPFDIATRWPGGSQGLSGTLTEYRIDPADNLEGKPFPRPFSGEVGA